MYIGAHIYMCNYCVSFSLDLNKNYSYIRQTSGRGGVQVKVQVQVLLQVHYNYKYDFKYNYKYEYKYKYKYKYNYKHEYKYARKKLYPGTFSIHKARI